MSHLEFAVRCDFVDLGRDSEGEQVVGFAFYVVAEDCEGRRWAHDRQFLDRVKAYDAEEGIVYWARRDWDLVEAAAERLRARIVAHVDAGGELADDCWVEIDPAYGSVAYQAADVGGYFAARERHQAREAGEAVAFDQAIDVHFA